MAGEVKAKMVEISEDRLAELEHAEEVLNALEAAGVDNWEGYGDALSVLDSEDED